MKISVLMSVYNAEKPLYLDRAIQSIWFDQTYKPSEIILVEDGPLTQDLYIIIDKWKKIIGDSFLLIKNEVNLGLTKSLNKGLKYVTNELIARMDSDDISHPRRFEIQHEFMIKNPNIAVVGGSLQEFNDSIQCINIRHYPENPETIRKYICKASPLAHPTVLMRKEIFDSGLKYNEHYRTSQDIALWYDIISSGYKISNVPDVTIYFRLSEDIFKRRSKQKALNEFKIYMTGIYKLYGLFTLYYVYPICRLLFRLMPECFIKWVYSSRLRKRILSN